MKYQCFAKNNGILFPKRFQKYVLPIYNIQFQATEKSCVIWKLWKFSFESVIDSYKI